ncbi:hypothetical protein BC826DRAFT_1053031, partial [Russula brevipes]
MSVIAVVGLAPVRSNRSVRTSWLVLMSFAAWQALTKRRMPIPVKITFAGENACERNNAYRTFTVGTIHFAVPSSLFLDFLCAGISPRRTA